MNRRTFIKRVGTAIAGLAGLPLVVKAKPRLTVEMVKKCRDELKAMELDWKKSIMIDYDYSPEHLRRKSLGPISKPIKFTDDTVMSMENMMDGKTLVFCKNSVWISDGNSDNCLKLRKL